MPASAASAEAAGAEAGAARVGGGGAGQEEAEVVEAVREGHIFPQTLVVIWLIPMMKCHYSEAVPVEGEEAADAVRAWGAEAEAVPVIRRMGRAEAVTVEAVLEAHICPQTLVMIWLIQRLKQMRMSHYAKMMRHPSSPMVMLENRQLKKDRLQFRLGLPVEQLCAVQGLLRMYGARRFVSSTTSHLVCFILALQSLFQKAIQSR